MSISLYSYIYIYIYIHTYICIYNSLSRRRDLGRRGLVVAGIVAGDLGGTSRLALGTQVLQKLVSSRL